VNAFHARAINIKEESPASHDLHFLFFFATIWRKVFLLYGGAMLEQLNRINVLYDIYSPLLTGRQQEVLKLYFSDNLSLGEIAQEYGISRQAVHDLIRRALSSIEAFEKKLGLYSLFHFQQERLLEADRILQKAQPDSADLERLKEIVRELRQRNEQ